MGEIMKRFTLLKSLHVFLFLQHDSLSFQPQFGLLFDIDGVIARGSTPLPAAIEGLQKLTDGAGNFVVPVAFVTNGCNTSSQKAKAITKWLGIEVGLKLYIVYRLPHTHIIWRMQPMQPFINVTVWP